MCVLGQLTLSLFLFFLFLHSTVFPLKKGYFCSFLRVSLSLWLHSLLLFTHSLSIFLVSCFLFSLPCCFINFLPSLFLAVLSCLVSLLLFHEKNNIKILHVKGFFSSILSVSFGFPVLFCL